MVSMERRISETIDELSDKKTISLKNEFETFYWNNDYFVHKFTPEDVAHEYSRKLHTFIDAFNFYQENISSLTRDIKAKEGCNTTRVLLNKALKEVENECSFLGMSYFKVLILTFKNENGNFGENKYQE